MIVMKFGGSSVADAPNILRVCALVRQASEKQQIAVVVSALGGTTDALLEASRNAASKNQDFREALSALENRHLQVIRGLIPIQHQSAIISEAKRRLNQLETLLEGCFLLGECSDRSRDAIVAFGELLSSYIVSEALKADIPEVAWVDSRHLIKTDSHFSNARVDFAQSNALIRGYFEQGPKVSVFPGFIGSTSSGDTTTLGRGGSDYTAAILGAAVQAETIEIWTDVSGMFTANPRIVSQASPIRELSYQEAMELSHFGAKVLYPPTIQPALDAGIPLAIRNTFSPEDAGTLISKEAPKDPTAVRGISHIQDLALLTLEGSGLIGVSGSSKRLFGVLSKLGISVIFITQASSEHSICLGISENQADAARAAIDEEFAAEIANHRIVPCEVETGLSIVALVGEGMKNHQGLSGKMFSTLGKNNVNIRAIAQGASERNISVVISSRDVSKALNSLHERFFEGDVRHLNLFVFGAGNVGKRFLAQLAAQKDFLRRERRINLKLVGLANSRTMAFDESGLSLEDWPSQLAAGEPAGIPDFIHRVKALNLHNSIVVDNTADASIAATYPEFLRDSIAVVTCNKIACSSAYANYAGLKELSRTYGAPFLFETNVGAGLPIIDTLKNLVASGDRVRKIRAVLSGSLNFIFNNYDGSSTFAEVVREAGRQGFTEPDPRIDLSGLDVARKILILIRESGYVMEADEIAARNFLPEGALEADSVPAFFDLIEKEDAHFRKLYADATARGNRLKFVADFENGKAQVGLDEVAPDHPFYHLEGKDNIVLFYTDRYPDQPLLIKGAGAGADVTASGIFADVIRVSS